MLGIQIRQPRFTLYHLDEGEMFIKEFAANCQFVYPETEKVENFSGVILIGSRSIIFEPDDHKYSIIKFHFRYISEGVKIVQIQNKEMFKLFVSKIIEVPCGKKVEPYKTYDIKSDVFIHFLFERIEHVAQIIYELLNKFNSKSTVFDFDSVEYLGNLYSFKFDYTRVKSINEKFLLKNEIFVKQILPLIEVPGLLMITDLRIYFQPLFTLNTKKCMSIKHKNINSLFKRRIKLREVGLEILASKNKEFMVLTESESDRDMLYDLINTYTPVNCLTNFSIEKYTKMWIDGSISNYDYLIALNSAANRTRNDLSQYPIFPWVVSNYEINELDLNNPNNFRDLSKPIGALNKKRLEMFIERYKQMPEPKFLYGTHYSNPGYVIGYLVRKYPQYMIKLHGGRFDHPDRLFNSIEIDWNICLNNQASLKELIPEFYEDNSDFLLNSLDLDLGYSSRNEKISRVKLPKWASDPADYLKKMRQSLESSYVSNNLHNWIDLIFGYKQKGQASIDANNVFHPLTYEGSVDLNSIQDPLSLKAIEIQVNEYGQTPKQLFNKPHPKRFSSKSNEVNINVNQNLEEKRMDKLDPFESLNIIENASEFNKDYNELNGEPNSVKNLNELDVESLQLNEKEISYNFERNYTCVPKFLKRKISCSIFQKENTLIVGSYDGYIKFCDYKTNKTKRMYNICNFHLTSIANLNNTNLIAIGAADNMVHIFNTSLGKEVTNFYAHEDSVVKIFYCQQSNTLITDGADSTCKLWDLSNNNKIPVAVFYDTETSIVASDYRTSDNLHIYIDEDGHFIIRNMKNEKECNKMKLDHHHFKIVKFNPINQYQYFIGDEQSLKIFDVRNNLEIDSIEEFAGAIDIFNDSKKFLVAKNESLELMSFSNLKIEKIKEWNNFGNISHINMNLNPDVIILGNESGDLFHSTVEN